MDKPTDEDRLRAADDLRENLPWIVGDVKAIAARIEAMLRRGGYQWPNGVVFSQAIVTDIVGPPGTVVTIEMRVDLPGAVEAAGEYLRRLADEQYDEPQREPQREPKGFVF